MADWGPRRRAGVITGAALAVGIGWWALAVHTPPGPRSPRVFQPDRLADLEVEMWRAYYRGERVSLFATLVIALREQLRYPWAQATRAAFHLARAAARFAAEGAAAREVVLRELERAYEIARRWSAAGYDARAVAEKELAWWVARRDPEGRDVENVGRLIAEVYAAFYEVEVEKVKEAGVLRARAAALRDRAGAAVDWEQVRRGLREAYSALAKGVR